MSITYHERPGVYSDYDASSVSATGAGRKVIALIGTSTAAAGLYTVTSYASGAATFGADSQLTKMLKLAYQNGAGTVLASPVSTDTLDKYQAAWNLVLAEKTASFIVIGSAQETVQTGLKSAIEEASKQKGECIGIVGLSQPTVSAMTTRATALNSERLVLVGPDVYLTGETAAGGGCMAAAALAGVLANETDPALPLNGAELKGLGGVTANYDDTELDGLITGGITVLETDSGKVQIIRAITTRTKTAGAADATYRELSTMLIIDDVIPAIRDSLRAKFTRAKNNKTTRSAIRSQVVVELEDRLAREIIDSYDSLTVTASTSDPTVCLVEFGFTVTHGLNRIYLTAHISV